MAAWHQDHLFFQEDLGGHLERWLLRLEPPRRKDGYSASSHRAAAYDDVTQEMHEKTIRPKHKLYWGAPQVVHLKWECTGATAIIKHDYKIDYVNVDSKGRKNRQCTSGVIVQVKKAKEHAETEAEVNAGQISLFGAFSKSSHGSSGKPPSPQPS